MRSLFVSILLCEGLLAAPVDVSVSQDMDFNIDAGVQPRGPMKFPLQDYSKYAKSGDLINQQNSFSPSSHKYSPPDISRNLMDNQLGNAQEPSLVMQNVPPYAISEEQDIISSGPLPVSVPGSAMATQYPPTMNNIMQNLEGYEKLAFQPVPGYTSPGFLPRAIPMSFLQPKDKFDIIRVTPELQAIIDSHRQSFKDSSPSDHLNEQDLIDASASTIQNLVVHYPGVPYIQEIDLAPILARPFRDSSQPPALLATPTQLKQDSVSLSNDPQNHLTQPQSASSIQKGGSVIPGVGNDDNRGQNYFIGIATQQASADGGGKEAGAVAQKSLVIPEGKTADAIARESSKIHESKKADTAAVKPGEDDKGKPSAHVLQQPLGNIGGQLANNFAEEFSRDGEGMGASDGGKRGESNKAQKVAQHYAKVDFSNPLKDNHVSATDPAFPDWVADVIPKISSTEAIAPALDRTSSIHTSEELLTYGAQKEGVESYSRLLSGLDSATSHLVSSSDTLATTESMVTGFVPRKSDNGTSATDSVLDSPPLLPTSADHSDAPGIAKNLSDYAELDGANGTEDETPSISVGSTISDEPELLNRKVRSADRNTFTTGIASRDQTTELDVVITGCQANSGCTASMKLGYLTVTEMHTSYVTYCPLANAGQLCLDGSCDSVDSLEILAEECGSNGCTLNDSGELLRLSGDAESDASTPGSIPITCTDDLCQSPRGPTSSDNELYMANNDYEAKLEGNERQDSRSGAFDTDNGPGKPRTRRHAEFGSGEIDPTEMSEQNVIEPGLSFSMSGMPPTQTIVTTVTETATTTQTLQASCSANSAGKHEEDVYRAISQNTSKIVEEVIRQLQTTINAAKGVQA